MITLSYTTVHPFTISDAQHMMMNMCYMYNNKIQAIKFIRAEYELGLKEAKDMCDMFWDIEKKAQIPQHWSTKYNGEPQYGYQPRKEASLGDLLKDKLNSTER